MKTVKFLSNPNITLVSNLIYALGNTVMGFCMHSWWFITVGAYYTVLATTRFCVLKISGKTDEIFARKITGGLLIALSFCIVGVNVLSAVKERGTVFHEIIMITIATYTFAKITVAIIGMAKAGKTASPVKKTLRNIALSDAAVSVYSMQRSMLISFPGMASKNVQMLNIFTGTVVWLVVLFLGINLIGGKKVDMAKSKLIKVNKKIAEAVTDGYKKIEKGVTTGYTKIEDKFVDAYLTRDGETVEEAKARLRNEK